MHFLLWQNTFYLCFYYVHSVFHISTYSIYIIRNCCKEPQKLSIFVCFIWSFPDETPKRPVSEPLAVKATKKPSNDQHPAHPKTKKSLSLYHPPPDFGRLIFVVAAAKLSTFQSFLHHFQ